MLRSDKVLGDCESRHVPPGELHPAAGLLARWSNALPVDLWVQTLDVAPIAMDAS